MDRSRERKSRTLWLSTDGGKTWIKVEALEGSLLYVKAFVVGQPLDDGYGNLYRADNPNT